MCSYCFGYRRGCPMCDAGLDPDESRDEAFEREEREARWLADDAEELADIRRGRRDDW